MITERYWAKQPPAMLRRGTSWHPVFMLDLCVSACQAEKGESQRNQCRCTVLHVCRQQGRKPHPAKGIRIQVLNGLCNCHHSSLMLSLKASAWFKAGEKKFFFQEGSESVTYICGLLNQMRCRRSPTACLKCVAQGDFNFRLVSI